MGYRKLGRTSDQRKAVLRGLVTALFEHDEIVTTETRAKEVQSIAERLIGKAVREADNFSTKQIKKSSAPEDSKGKRMTMTVESKNKNKYTKFQDRVIKTELVRVDSPSRLSARHQAMLWIYKTKDKDGENLNVVNKLFDDIAVKYKDRKGGYTRIFKTGARRGDGAPMCILRLV